jgi:hypothetical protein
LPKRSGECGGKQQKACRVVQSLYVRQDNPGSLGQMPQQAANWHHSRYGSFASHAQCPLSGHYGPSHRGGPTRCARGGLMRRSKGRVLVGFPERLMALSAGTRRCGVGDRAGERITLPYANGPPCILQAYCAHGSFCPGRCPDSNFGFALSDDGWAVNSDPCQSQSAGSSRRHRTPSGASTKSTLPRSS